VTKSEAILYQDNIATKINNYGDMEQEKAAILPSIIALKRNTIQLRMQ